jgi:hypothetical protein
MKFFNKTANQIGPVSKNDEKLWQDIVKLFGSDKKVSINHFTSNSDIINTARNEYYNGLREKLYREHQSPKLESNADEILQ